VKKIRFLVINLLCVPALAVSLFIGLASPASANTADQYTPASINGLPVLMVQTPANTYDLNNGRIITVLDNLSSSEEEAKQRFISNNASVMAILSPGDMIEVYGGPGASKEQYIKIHEENNVISKECSPITVDVPTKIINNNETESKATQTLNPAFAIFQESDNSIRTVRGISAHMVGINIGTSQSNYSAFMVNGITNSGYFLQSGQAYYGIGSGGNGTCGNIWADPTHNNNQGMQFNLPYVTNHDYLYDITYMGSPGVWEMGAKDENAGIFDLFIEYNGRDSQLVNNQGTSVFFENWNTNANWWYGFPMWVICSHARELVSNQKINWTNGSIIINRGGIIYPNNGKLSGSLLNDQTALWDLTLLLLAQ